MRDRHPDDPRLELGDEELPPPFPDDLLDAALTRLHTTDPEFGGGLSNHGPMAAEALEALGAPQQIPTFVDRYASRLSPMPTASPLPARCATAGKTGFFSPPWPGVASRIASTKIVLTKVAPRTT